MPPKALKVSTTEALAWNHMVATLFALLIKVLQLKGYSKVDCLVGGSVFFSLGSNFFSLDHTYPDCWGQYNTVRICWVTTTGNSGIGTDAPAHPKQLLARYVDEFLLPSTL